MADFLDKIYADGTLFNQYYSKGYDDLLISLRLADEKISQRILRTKGEWTKTKLNQIKALIQEEIGNAYGNLFSSMQSESVETAQLVYGLMLDNINSELPKGTIEDLINSKRPIRMSIDKVYEFKDLFNLTEENHIRQLKNIVASGVAQSLTPVQIVSQYNIQAEKLSKGQLVGNIFTVIAESRKEGRTKAYEKLERDGIIEGYEYNATLDSSTTEYCRVRDNRIYPTLESINLEINAHARCRSIALPITELTAELRADSQRASQTGTTANVSYEQWFLNQPKSLQRSTLTNRRYEAFLKGRYKVDSLADLNKRTSLETIKDNFERYINN